MAYGLPTRGQADWDDEINNSIEAVKASADSALSKAIVAESKATQAQADVTGAVARVETISGLKGEDAAMTDIDANPLSQFRQQNDARLSATYAAKPSSNVIDDEVGDGNALAQHTASFGQAGQKARVMSGNSTTAIGYVALADGAYTGVASAAVGTLAGQYATTGSNLCFVGYRAGGGVTTAAYATYTGSWSGAFPSGAYNTGFGGRALGGPNPPRDATNTTQIDGADLATWKDTTPIGARNVAVGYEALTTIGSGNDNVAVGYEAAGGIGAQLTISAMTVSGTTVTVTVSDAGGLVVGEPIAFFGTIEGFTENAPEVGKLYNVTSKTGNDFTYEQNPAPVGTYSSGGYVLGGVITGSNNVAAGSFALYQNQRGSNNVAVGYYALKNADVGSSSVAVGYAALASQKNAANNVAIGTNAGTNVTTGGTNVFVGRDAGLTVTTDNATTTATGQVVIGYQAGQGSATAVSQITAVGHRAVANGSWATAIGANTSAGGSGAIANGCVAIGTDNTGAGAQATAANEFALGTANHNVRVAGYLRLDREQTTVGAAGAASALPTAPTKYLSVKDSTGTEYVFPVYAKA